METLQWEEQTEHVVWKQFSGQNMEGFCGSGTFLKHVYMYVLCVLMCITQNKSVLTTQDV
jgi:hypothetical protein